MANNKELIISRERTSKWYKDRFRTKRFDWYCGLWHPRFFVSIVVAWITVLVGNDLLPITSIENIVIDSFFKNPYFYIVIFAVTIIGIVVIACQIQNKSKGIKWKKDKCRWIRVFVMRPLTLIITCLLYSAFLSIFMSLFTDNYCVPLDDDWDCIMWFNCDYLSPFWVNAVILSVLIGVVLEIVTEKKPTEED